MGGSRIDTNLAVGLSLWERAGRGRRVGECLRFGVDVGLCEEWTMDWIALGQPSSYMGLHIRWNAYDMDGQMYSMTTSKVCRSVQQKENQKRLFQILILFSL